MSNYLASAYLYSLNTSAGSQKRKRTYIYSGPTTNLDN